MRQDPRVLGQHRGEAPVSGCNRKRPSRKRMTIVFSVPTLCQRSHARSQLRKTVSLEESTRPPLACALH